jgi:VanZ family protein
LTRLNKKNFIRYWIPVILWAGVIFYASSQPYQEQDLKPTLLNYINVEILAPYFDQFEFTYAGGKVSIEELGTAGFIEFFIRKGAHLTVYLILAFLFYRAFIKTTHITTKRTILFSLAAAILYAASDEFHQSITPNRSPHWEDIGLDSVGALIGVFIAVFLYRKNLHRY